MGVRVSKELDAWIELYIILERMINSSTSWTLKLIPNLSLAKTYIGTTLDFYGTQMQI